MVTRTTAWVVLHQLLVSYFLKRDSRMTFLKSARLRRKPGKQQDGTDAVPGNIGQRAWNSFDPRELSPFNMLDMLCLDSFLLLTFLTWICPCIPSVLLLLVMFPQGLFELCPVLPGKYPSGCRESNVLRQSVFEHLSFNSMAKAPKRWPVIFQHGVVNMM